MQRYEVLGKCKIRRKWDGYVFFYDKGSRGEKVLKPKLLKRKAAIQSDGYVVYQQVEQSELYAVVTLYCMAHARRKFEAIRDSSPEAQKVLYYIAVLYMLEANLKERKATHDEIRAERQEKAVPILAVIRKLLEKYKTVDTPKSALTQACNYALERWDGLLRKYFQSRQPATLEDFVWWSGLNVSDCRKGIALLGDSIHVEKWKGRELPTASPLTLGHKQASLHGSRSTADFYLTDDCRTRGFRKGKFLLIPPYDEYLISYKSRDIVLPPEHRHHAYNNSGIFQPVIAYDGTICGNWAPFKDDCQATFFAEIGTKDITKAWQSYLHYRRK